MYSTSSGSINGDFQQSIGPNSIGYEDTASYLKSKGAASPAYVSLKKKYKLTYPYAHLSHRDSVYIPDTNGVNFSYISSPNGETEHSKHDLH